MPGSHDVLAPRGQTKSDSGALPASDQWGPMKRVLSGVMYTQVLVYLWFVSLFSLLSFVFMHFSEHVPQHIDTQVLRGIDGHIIPHFRTHTGEWLYTTYSRNTVHVFMLSGCLPARRSATWAPTRAFRPGSTPTQRQGLVFGLTASHNEYSLRCWNSVKSETINK